MSLSDLVAFSVFSVGFLFEHCESIRAEEKCIFAVCVL